MANRADIWTAKHVQSLAPDAASVPAAKQVLKKGGFGTVEPTADGRGWWVVCRGITDTYQVSARLQPGGQAFDCECTCPSYKNPCKHALALLFYLVDHPELRVEKEEAKAAASDFDALLKAVYAHPDDDTPRLVFADFVEENGDSDRAALIRLQCEQARLKPQAKRYKELTALLKPLLAKARKRIEPLPEDARYTLRRGFVRLEGEFGYLDDVGSLPARFAALFRDGWVESVAMRFLPLDGLHGGAVALLSHVGEIDVSTFPMAEDTMIGLAAVSTPGHIGRLARVRVHRNSQKTFDKLVRAAAGEEVSLAAHLGADRRHGSLTPATYDLLLRTGRLCGARRMTLGGIGLGDEQLRTLLDTADLSDLRELWLSGWTLSRDGVAALANSPNLNRLTELNFHAVPLGQTAGAFDELAANSGLRNVETLRLVGCGLGDAGARTLAKSRCLPKLKRLELTRNEDLTDAGVAAVLASAHFPQFVRLILEDNPALYRRFLPLLLAASDRPELELATFDTVVRRRITKENVIIEIESHRGDFVEAFLDLSGAKGGERVTQLSAQSLDFGAAEMPALAAGFDPQTLRKLDLTDNPLRNEGAAALAEAFAGFHLRELVLAECRVQATGVAALAAGALYGRLHALDLSRNTVGKAGVAALLKADVPPNLKRLTLAGCRLDADDKKKLKAKFGPRLKL
jgi:uncharacterized protein (TIGR02996 family)